MTVISCKLSTPVPMPTVIPDLVDQRHVERGQDNNSWAVYATTVHRTTPPPPAPIHQVFSKNVPNVSYDIILAHKMLKIEHHESPPSLASINPSIRNIPRVSRTIHITSSLFTKFSRSSTMNPPPCIHPSIRNIPRMFRTIHIMS